MAIVPELALLFAIPNGGARSPATAAKLKATGTKAGVSDMFLPVARHGFHGLWIELKKLKGGKESQEQKDWGAAMQAQGYAYCCCLGWMAAARALMLWLDFAELPWDADGRLMLGDGIGDEL
ncbi:MAG: VRR-NUC domain-containing protein [Candidatus Magasanikiibacteriota bacterium]